MAGRLRVTGRTVRGGYSPDMTDKEFKKGDEVTWQSHGGTAEGTVEEKITADTHAAKRTVRASKDEPRYQVRSEKSGSEAVHKPEALKKKSS
ncbi:hypothetical protein BH10ACT9_BH10ACT9_37950 [soil metagenome]